MYMYNSKNRVSNLKIEHSWKATDSLSLSNPSEVAACVFLLTRLLLLLQYNHQNGGCFVLIGHLLCLLTCTTTCLYTAVHAQIATHTI